MEAQRVTEWSRAITTAGTERFRVRVAPFTTEPIGGRNIRANFRAVQRQDFPSTLYQPDNSCELVRGSATCTSADGCGGSSSVRPARLGPRQPVTRARETTSRI